MSKVNATHRNPDVPGYYEVVFQYVRSFVPYQFEWDGQRWLLPSYLSEPSYVGEMYWFEPAQQNLPL